MANDGVSEGSDEAVAELAASVADEAVAELADDKSLLKGRVPQVSGQRDPRSLSKQFSVFLTLFSFAF